MRCSFEKRITSIHTIMMARRITGTKVPREGEKVISNKLMKKTMI